MTQFAIQDVFELDFVDYKTKKPEFYIDYAQTTNNTFTGTRTFINGGHGNQRLYSFDSDKQSQLAVTNALFDNKALAQMAGGNIIEGASNVFQRDVNSVAADHTFTLTKEPVADGYIYVGTLDRAGRDFETEIVVGDPATGTNVYGIEGTTLTFSDDIAPGTQIGVLYEYTLPETTKRIEIDADKFSKEYTIYGKGIWDDQQTGERKVVKFIIYRARPTAEFAINMSASEPATLEMTLDLTSDKLPDGRSAMIDYFETDDVEGNGGGVVNP